MRTTSHSTRAPPPLRSTITTPCITTRIKITTLNATRQDVEDSFVLVLENYLPWLARWPTHEPRVAGAGRGSRGPRVNGKDLMFGAHNSQIATLEVTHLGSGEGDGRSQAVHAGHRRSGVLL